MYAVTPAVFVYTSVTIFSVALVMQISAALFIPEFMNLHSVTTGVCG